MKVYIIVGYDNFDDVENLGVFDSREKAEKQNTNEYPMYDNYRIEEWEVC